MDEEKNKKLVVIINKLSTNLENGTKEIEECIAGLKEIYTDDFRHLYSQLFLTVSTKSEEENDILIQNINYLYNYINDNPENELCFKKQILKIYDHINIEVVKMKHNKAMEEKDKKEKEKLQENIGNSFKKLERVKEETDKIKKEYIVILGIFSSIVIAFVSAMTFSASVLQNIEKSSIYRLLLVIWLIGFIFVLLIEILTNFILKITQKEESNGSKIRATGKYVVFFIGIFFIFLSWVFDFSSLRDEMINRKTSVKNESTIQQKY